VIYITVQSQDVDDNDFLNPKPLINSLVKGNDGSIIFTNPALTDDTLKYF
jgi:hypothetical protein